MLRCVVWGVPFSHNGSWCIKGCRFFSKVRFPYRFFALVFASSALFFSCEKPEAVYRATESTLKSAVTAELEGLEWNESLRKDGMNQKKLLSLESSSPVQMLNALPPYTEPIVSSMRESANENQAKNGGKMPRGENVPRDGSFTDSANEKADDSFYVTDSAEGSAAEPSAHNTANHTAQSGQARTDVYIKDVYPSYKDFGILDSSSCPRAVLDFCFEFLKKTVYVNQNARAVPSSMLDASYPFLQLLVSEQLSAVPRADRVLFGRAFYADGVWEIPVRCESAGTHTDLVLFVAEKVRSQSIQTAQNTGARAGSYVIEQLYVGECVYE